MILSLTNTRFIQFVETHFITVQRQKAKLRLIHKYKGKLTNDGDDRFDRIGISKNFATIETNEIFSYYVGQKSAKKASGQP